MNSGKSIGLVNINSRLLKDFVQVIASGSSCWSIDSNYETTTELSILRQTSNVNPGNKADTPLTK